MWLVLLEAERIRNRITLSDKFCLAKIRECLQLHLVPLIGMLFH